MVCIWTTLLGPWLDLMILVGPFQLRISYDLHWILLIQLEIILKSGVWLVPGISASSEHPFGRIPFPTPV